MHVIITSRDKNRNIITSRPYEPETDIHLWAHVKYAHSHNNAERTVATKVTTGEVVAYIGEPIATR